MKEQDAASGRDERIREAVERIFSERINPALAGHGGFVRLVGVDNGDVQVELGGGCQGCSGARMTLKYGIEAVLKEEIPDMGAVVDVTEHASGA